MKEYVSCLKPRRVVNYYRKCSPKKLQMIMQRLMDGTAILSDRRIFMIRDRAQELAEEGLLNEDIFYVFENWVSNNVTQYAEKEDHSWADDVQEKFLKGELCYQ